MGREIEATDEELKLFLQETDEQLQLLDECLVRLEKEADNVELLQEIFRAAHTLKGSSSMLGFQEIAELTDAMEDVLDRLRKGTLTVTPELVDALLQGLDGLRVLKAGLGSEDGASLDADPVVAALRAVAEEGPNTTSPDAPMVRTLEGAVAADPALAEKLQAAAEAGLSLHRVVAVIEQGTQLPAVRLLQVLTELSGQGEIIVSVPTQQQIEEEQAGSELQALVATSRLSSQLRASIDSVADVHSTAVEPWGHPEETGITVQDRKEIGSRKMEVQQTMRVDVDRLDTLMNIVGELVIDRNRIDQLAKALYSQYGETDLTAALEETSTHIVKGVDELNESMMQIRMLPVGTLFSTFPRLVRDLARSTGKSVNFVLQGEDTEIDRSVIERIKDPLIHLIRNAVDHAIEPPQARREAGKPESGLVKLSARHEQGHIVITLTDDGKGIDSGSLRQSAVRQGIIPEEAAARLSDVDSLDLVFAPGVSTATSTTEVSGRGVGMDVVKRAVEALNGVVQVETRLGVGTTITMRLPLTLATFRGLLVEAAKTVYAVPLSYVQEAVRPEPGSIQTVLGRQVLNLRGNVMPLVRLRDIFRTGSKNGHQINDDFVVVVKMADRSLAVSLDALIAQQEIVVKPLDGHVGHSGGVSGASILGDGRVVLILDVPTLFKTADRSNPASSHLERSVP